MINILRLTPFYLHNIPHTWDSKYDPVGGMQVQIRRFALWLSKSGKINQLVITGGSSKPEEYMEHENLKINQTLPPLIQIKSNITGLIGLVPNWCIKCLFKCIMLKISNEFKPHLIHGHGDGTIWPLMLTPLVSKLFGVPYILTIHCSRTVNYKPMSSFDKIINKIVIRAEQFSIKKASCTVVFTDRTKESILKELDLEDFKIRVIPEAINISEFRNHVSRDATMEFSRKWNISDDTVVGYVGRIAHEKGWRDVIRVAKLLKSLPIKYLIVGDGPQRKLMEKEIRDNGLESKFIITGFIPSKEVALAIESVDLVIMPSIHEEFGVTLLEALGSGKIAVAYGVGGILDILSKTQSDYICQPYDYEEMAEKIEYILRNSEILRDIEKDNMSYISNHFHSDRIYPKFINLYEQIGKL